MDYYNSLTYEQRRTLHDAATVLNVTVGTLLGLPRDDPLSNIAIPRPEQFLVSPQLHLSDTAFPEIAALTFGPLSGDQSWPFYPPFVAHENIFSPSPGSNASSSPPNIVNPWPDSLYPGTTPPTQRFHHFPLTSPPSAAANNFEMVSGLLDVGQDGPLHDDGPPSAGHLHPPGDVTATTQAPAPSEQPMTKHRAKWTTLRGPLSIPPSPRKAKVRSCYDAKRRAQTAQTREIRACMQCRQNRNRVGEPRRKTPRG